MDFKDYKDHALKQLNFALLKGEVDEPIIPLLEKINLKQNLYTTSSCYGRITLDLVPYIDNKRDHKWIAKWHRTVSVEEVIERIVYVWENEDLNYKVLYIKQDPFILHIGVDGIESAEKLLNIARNQLGLKRSGIMHTKPRIMLELMGLDHVSMPLIIDGKKTYDEDALSEVVDLLNTKFKRNEERLLSLIDKIANNF